MSVTSLAFHITDRCQLNCDHCLRDPQLKSTELTVEFIDRLLAEATELFNTDHVGLTGGEPTLHPDFAAIADAIVDRRYTWHFVSNGERFARVIGELSERPERIDALARVHFSLDGATRETHDSIRGEGSYDNVLRAVSTCVAIDVPFHLQIALNARNVHEVEQFGLLSAQLGASKATFGLTTPSGTFLDRNLYLRPEEWRSVARRVQRLSDVLAIPVSWTSAFPSDYAYHSCDPWSGDPLHIDNRGRLNLCCLHSGVPSADEGVPSDVAGDLNDMPLADAWMRLLDIIADTKKWRARDIIEGNTEAWDSFPCNWCMKAHGKPHWSGAGAAGPGATRERWRGAWAPGYKDSHVEAAKEAAGES